MSCCCVNKLCNNIYNVDNINDMKGHCCVNSTTDQEGKIKDCDNEGQSVLLVHEERQISDRHFVLILVLASLFSIFAGG